MNAVFNRNGRTIAWLNGTEIFDINGISIDFLNNQAVYNLQGNYKGTFTDVFFRDYTGNAVAYIQGASNGPVPPVPPIQNIPPIHPIPEIQPVSPIPSFNWSNIDWNEYIR
jgi:hypothetical protein